MQKRGTFCDWRNCNGNKSKKRLILHFSTVCGRYRKARGKFDGSRDITKHTMVGGILIWLHCRVNIKNLEQDTSD